MNETIHIIPADADVCPGCDLHILSPGIIDETKTDSSGIVWHIDCLDDYRAGD